MKRSNSINIYAERIHLIVNYISEHISEEINLGKLASVACFSPFHFHRIFSAITGETPRGYIERVRLEKAANRLCLMRNRTVTNIAFDCGFKSTSSFSKAFKKFHGISPTKFIETHKNDFHSLNLDPELRIRKISEDDLSSIVIRKIPPYNVIYAQMIEGYRLGIPQAWRKVSNHAQINDLWQSPSCLIGLPYDNPGITPNDKCRYRACIPVNSSIVIKKGNIQTLKIEASTCAVYHFKGKRKDLTNAYAMLYGEWLVQSGYIPDEKPSMEIYPTEIISDINKEILEYDIALPIVTL